MPAHPPAAHDFPRRWTPAAAAAALDAFDRSGLTATEFSRRTGIQLQRLRRWRSRLEASPARATVQLVELVPRAPASDATGDPVEVMSPGGWRIQVPRELLPEVLRALSVARC